MDEADIARIESALVVRLRPDYRQFLLAHGDDLRRAEREFAFGMDLHRDPDLVIEHNNAVRERPELWTVGREDGTEEPFPASYFVVGGDGGDWLYIHQDGADPGVWFLGHDAYENTRRYASLEEYAAGLRRDFADPQSWRRGEPNTSPAGQKPPST